MSTALTTDAKIALHEWLTTEMNFAVVGRVYRHREFEVRVGDGVVQGQVPNFTAAEIRTAIVDAVDRAREDGGVHEPIFERHRPGCPRRLDRPDGQ
jgi:hypothetical protein